MSKLVEVACPESELGDVAPSPQKEDK